MLKHRAEIRLHLRGRDARFQSAHHLEPPVRRLLQARLRRAWIAWHAGAELRVERTSDEPTHRSLHGLTRSLIANMVTGVTDGYSRRLEVNGVGYRAAVSSGSLVLQVGYSHPVLVPAPAGISFVVQANAITVSGADKELVGETAAQIRRVRPPEPYKGKGIKYAEEVIRRKAGKAGAKKK